MEEATCKVHLKAGDASCNPYLREALAAGLGEALPAREAEEADGRVLRENALALYPVG